MRNRKFLRGKKKFNMDPKRVSVRCIYVNEQGRDYLMVEWLIQLVSYTEDLTCCWKCLNILVSWHSSRIHYELPLTNECTDQTPWIWLPVYLNTGHTVHCVLRYMQSRVCNIIFGSYTHYLALNWSSLETMCFWSIWVTVVSFTSAPLDLKVRSRITPHSRCGL